MISLIAEISEQIGRITVSINPHLRRVNRIRTIHSSLAIEHNSLSLQQVTAILDGKRVLGNPNEIREVQNAYEAYELMLQLDPSSIDHLLKAHKLMMQGLIPKNGAFRSGDVGVFDGEVLVHMAPPAEFVPEHIHNLFAWYQESELHPLIKSAIFHYEFDMLQNRMIRCPIIFAKWNFRVKKGIHMEYLFYLVYDNIEFISSGSQYQACKNFDGENKNVKTDKLLGGVKHGENQDNGLHILLEHNCCIAAYHNCISGGSVQHVLLRYVYRYDL